MRPTTLNLNVHEKSQAERFLQLFKNINWIEIGGELKKEHYPKRK